MAHKALGIWRGGLLFMVDTEGLGVKGGLDVSGVAGRLNKAGDCSRVTGPAIGHSELRRDLFRGVVAIHAVEHLGQRQVGEAGAARYLIVARGAIEPEFFLRFEMRNVREIDVDVLARNHLLGDHTPAFGETGILDLFRRVASAATLGIERRTQVRLNAGLGMTSRALRVSWEGPVNSARLELVAEGAIGAKTGGRIDANLLVYMVCVRKLEKDRASISIPRKWNEIRLAAGRESSVALGAHDLFDFLFEVVGVASLALIVTRPLQNHRPLLGGRVANSAFQATKLLGMERMNEELPWLRLLLRLHGGTGFDGLGLWRLCLRDAFRCSGWGLRLSKYQKRGPGR